MTDNETPHADETAPTRCRHCYEDIERLPSGIWVNLSGFTACAKARTVTDALLTHEPMPVVTPPGGAA